MGGDRNTVHLLSREGADINVESWPAMAKEDAMVAMGKVMPETVKAAQHRKLSEPGSANA